MRRKLILVRTFVAMGIFALGLASLPAATLPTRTELFRMLRQGQYDDLERIATELRSEKLEFYQGHSELSQFYGMFEIAKSLDDSVWSNHIDRLERWAKATPDSPTALVVLGNIYASYAWKARGGGYANTVTEEGWRQFEERLTRARDLLDEAAKKKDQDPEAYRVRITVAMGLNESKSAMDAIFKKGIAVNPNYLPLYQAKAYFLLPRWQGDPGDWEAFAQQAADARGGEEGDMLYMIIARDEAWSEGDRLFHNTQLSYERMKRGFEAALKRNPDYLWDVNSFCYFACIAGDRAKAKELFQKIDGRWEKGVWSTQTAFQQWENWALRNGRAPSTSNRVSSSSSPSIDPAKFKSALLIGGIVWLVIVAAVGAGIWQLAKNYRKSG